MKHSPDSLLEDAAAVTNKTVVITKGHWQTFAINILLALKDCFPNARN